MPEFRFKIGDTCKHKSAAPLRGTGEASWAFSSGSSTRYIILGRLTEECGGGVQLLYLVRMVVADGRVEMNPFYVSEFEMEAAS